jgi:uncharacterized membrane protein
MNEVFYWHFLCRRHAEITLSQGVLLLLWCSDTDVTISGLAIHLIGTSLLSMGVGLHNTLLTTNNSGPLPFKACADLKPLGLVDAQSL